MRCNAFSRLTGGHAGFNATFCHVRIAKSRAFSCAIGTEDHAKNGLTEGKRRPFRTRDMAFCVAVDGTCNGSQIQTAGYQGVTPTAKKHRILRSNTGYAHGEAPHGASNGNVPTSRAHGVTAATAYGKTKENVSAISTQYAKALTTDLG